MNFAIIARVLGLLMMIFSLTLVPPMLISIIYQDGTLDAFIYALMITFGIGFVAWYPVRNHKRELKTRDGFIITVLFWIVLSFSGSVPLYLAEHPDLSYTDAFFESLSGWTTTGATVITGLDYLPQSILWYRQQLQWLGGMGIIVLAVAVLPMLGIGGMQLFRAEFPGPVKDSKLTPRITETAKALWYIYLSLTIACALAYWFAGMTLFDAIAHSFATVAIGGFSTHDASLGFFDSPAIEMVAIIFMLISTLNFGLHFYAWKNKSILHYFLDSEFKFLFGVLFGGALLTIAALWITDTYSLSESVRNGLFQLVSIATTSGFGTEGFADWPVFLPVLLFMMAFIGGCAGSTGGGMKVIRVLLIYKQGNREISRLIHPNAIIPIKINKRTVNDRVLESVWGFFSVYVLTYMVMMIALLATGLDHVTAFSAVGACLNNLGPGLGEVASNYGDISDVAKWILSITMLLGRLEIFTFLVLLSPVFWRN